MPKPVNKREQYTAAHCRMWSPFIEWLVPVLRKRQKEVRESLDNRPVVVEPAENYRHYLVVDDAAASQ